MKKILLATAAIAVAAAAHASVIPTLTSVTDDGGGQYTYTYDGYLAGDQGLVSGDQLDIFNFAGYVPGSISNGGYADITAMATTGNPNGLQLPPGFTIQPGTTTLIFTYTGPDYHTSGGPFSNTVFSGLSARSTIGTTSALGGFSAVAEKNTGPETGTPTYNDGYVGVPGAVPEPASWAIMLFGFGLAGASFRARRRAVPA